jgi:hypothetical protein
MGRAGPRGGTEMAVTSKQTGIVKNPEKILERFHGVLYISHLALY